MLPERGHVVYFEGHDYTITDVDTGKGLVEFRRPAGLVVGDTPYRRGVCALSELTAVDRAVGVSMSQAEAARALRQSGGDESVERKIFEAGQNAMTRFMALASGEQLWILPRRVLSPAL